MWPFKKKPLVFCSECKFFMSLLPVVACTSTMSCRCPSNKVKFVTWLRYSDGWEKHPMYINARNNCKNYQPIDDPGKPDTNTPQEAL